MSKKSTYVTANADTSKSRVRRELLEGREHLVVPVAMLGEGVIPGSEGPVFYPKEENAKTPERWNAMPVVVYHPKVANQFVSAREPDMFNARKVGVVLNAAHPGDKLIAEAWLDPERLKQVDVRVLTAVESEQPMEVSTGLTAEMEEVEGEHNGVPYKGKVSNYEPDHLAILPDQIGAFSVAMGGGLFANNVSVSSTYSMADFIAEQAMLVNSADAEMEFSSAALPDGSFRIETADDLKTAVRAVRRARNYEQAVAHVRNRAAALGLTSLIPDDWNKFKIGNELSTDEVASMIRRELAAKLGEPGQYWRGYIESVYSDSVVFWDKEKLWKMGYSVSDSKVTLKSESPVEVVRTTDYRPVRNVGGASETPVMTPEEYKTTLVNAIITNGGAWEEADRATLSGFSPEKLTKLATPAPASPAAPVAAATPPQVTLQQLVANSKDPALVQFYSDLQASHARERTDLVAKVKANPNNSFTDEALNGMPMDNLRAVAALATPTVEQQLFANGQYDLMNSTGGTRFPLANGYPSVAQPVDLPDPPEVPDMFPTK